MPIPEPTFMRDMRMQQMVDERVDMWMTQRIAPVLAYLDDCDQTFGGVARGDEVRRLLLEGLD